MHLITKNKTNYYCANNYFNKFIATPFTQNKTNGCYVKKTEKKSINEIPEWVEIIEDLHHGAGYSYTKIALRTGLSKSTIQKIVSRKRNEPRYTSSKALIQLYRAVFYSKNHDPYVDNYIRLKKTHHLEWLKNISNASIDIATNKKQKRRGTF